MSDVNSEDQQNAGDRYQVVGECAHVNVVGVGGIQAVQLLYKGAFLPDGVDEGRLKHLVDSGLVAKVAGEPLAPNAAIEQDPNTGDPLTATVTSGDGTHPEVTEDQRQEQRAATEETTATEQKRAAARAKLPADGSAPHHNAAHEVWVEYAVKQGLDRTESEKASKDDLKRALQK